MHYAILAQSKAIFAYFYFPHCAKLVQPVTKAGRFPCAKLAHTLIYSHVYIAMPAKYKSVRLWWLRRLLGDTCALPFQQKDVPIRSPNKAAVFRIADKMGGD